MAAKFDRQKAHQLYSGNMSDRKIASALNVSANTVRRWRLQENLPAHKPQSNLDDAQFHQLYDQGLSDAQIASMFDVSPSTVTRWRWKSGLPANRSSETGNKTIDPDEIQSLFMEGLSVKQIAKLFSCSDQTIYNFCRDRSIELPRNRKPTPDSAFDPDEARKLYNAGSSDADIAQKLDVTPYTIAKWRKHESLPSNHSLELDEQKLRTLHAQGLSDSQIAKALGCSPQTVLRRRRKYRLSANPTRQRSLEKSKQSSAHGTGRKLKIDVELARTLYNDGLSDREMAIQLGVSTGTVRNWRYREDLAANSRRGRQLEEQRQALSNDTRDDWDQEQALELWLDGLNDHEIAKKLGIEPSVAEAWRMNLGLPPVPKFWGSR